MSKTITNSGSIPLSSLRLIVPPLQLVSAALLEIVKQGAVMYYGLLEEFITTVLETVPELLTYTEGAQLVMGLRAREVLELCRSDDIPSPQTIQPHLNRINSYIKKQDKEISSFEIHASVTNFLKLVHTLVDDHHQRDIFYQKIYPTVFGHKYDLAVQALMGKFLLNLQKLLPVPSLEETSLWLSLSPSILKECVDLMNQPEHLNALLQHHKPHGHQVPHALSSTGDDFILSSLSCHLPKVDNNEEYTAIKSESVHSPEDWHRDISLGSEPKMENIEEFSSEMDIGRNGQQQHVDDLTEDQVASVEVILQPFDESDSSDDDDVDKKSFRRVKTHSKAFSKTFKCLVCAQDFGSLSKLKRHKMTHSDRFMNRLDWSDPVRQSSFVEKNNLQPKPKICSEKTTSKNENEHPSLAGASTHNPSNLNALPNFEQSNDRLVCRVCGQVFTYPKNFYKHHKICEGSRKQQTPTGSQGTTSLALRSKPNPVLPPEEPFLTETKAESSSVASQEVKSSDLCKRSRRVKTCSICGEIFTCAADLIRHMRCHTEQSPYLCSYCGESFDNFEDREAHEESKCRVSKQYPQAEDDFAQENSSSITNKSSRESMCFSRVTTIPDTPADSQACKLPLTCQECGQSFTYYKSFEKHQSKCSEGAPRKKKQKNTNASQCIISGCNFQSANNTNKTHSETRESETAAHQSSADCADGSLTKPRTIKCTMCEKNFSEIDLMKRHYSKAHKIRGPYPCPLCKRTFVRLCELVRHQQNRELYQCAACKKCYSKPGLLNDHEKVHTASVTPCVCETCGKSFGCLAYLIMHQRKHTERQPSVCSYCGKQFSRKDCLKAHMVRHTGGYPCPLCGKKFNQKTYLKWHLYKHTGEAPYLCDTCGKGWPSAAQLKLHMIQHSEERPFKCEDCGVSYKRASHLMAHRRAKHIRLRPFVCEVCSKAFRLNNELKKHMMVHTGERPFTCSRCGKTFTRKSRLRVHREKACL